jgi:hypothetical protein
MDLDAATALVLELALRDLRQLTETLTHTQKRCSELNDENRAMKMAASSLIEPTEWKATVAKALASLQGKSK